jgi:hypothetical protein
MGIFEDLKAWTDADGLVAPRPCDPNGHSASGNGVLFTSETMVIASIVGALTSPEAGNYLNTMGKCFKIQGLLCRGPFQPDQEAADDYIGLAAGLASIADGSKFPIRNAYANIIAAQVLNYGAKNPVKGFFGLPFRYVYNNVNPGQWDPQAWLGRMQNVLVLYSYVLGRKIALWSKIWLSAACLMGAFAQKTDTDARILSWLSLYVANSLQPSFLTKLTAKIWNWRVKKDYPNGMKDIFSLYFTPAHPIAVYTPEKTFAKV